jgi:hypothetical protein
MIKIDIASEVPIVTMGADLEPITTRVKLSFEDVQQLYYKRILETEHKKICIDLDNGEYFGKEIINIIDLKQSIKHDFIDMCDMHEGMTNYNIYKNNGVD